MFDDIKDEVTIPLTQWAINFGTWATAIGKRYNYMRVYAERTVTFKEDGPDGGELKVPQTYPTCIVERKRRWDR